MSKWYYMQLPWGVVKTKNPECWPEGNQMSEKEGRKALADEARKHLKKILKPGDTVYTVLKHVSQSGMSRRIDFYAIKKNQPVFLSGWMADLLDYRQHKDGCLVVGGCGMDMGFSVVYNLGYALWPKGTPKPHGKRNGEPDHSGGYALEHKWI